MKNESNDSAILMALTVFLISARGLGRRSQRRVQNH